MSFRDIPKNATFKSNKEIVQIIDFCWYFLISNKYILGFVKINLNKTFFTIWMSKNAMFKIFEKFNSSK